MQDHPVREAPSLFGLPPEKGSGACCIRLIINLCMGSIYAWSVFVGPLTGYFTAEPGQAVTANDILMPFSVFLAVFAVTMPFTGRSSTAPGPERDDHRRCADRHWLAPGFLCLLCPGARSAVWRGRGIGVGITYSVLVAVSARWFPDQRGLRSGLRFLVSGSPRSSPPISPVIL